MAEQTVWNSMVSKIGVRQARRLATFIECWYVSAWTSPPTSAHLVDDWGFSPHEVSYWLEQYRVVFARESDPSRLVSLVARDHLYVGIHQLQQTSLRRLTDAP